MLVRWVFFLLLLLQSLSEAPVAHAGQNPDRGHILQESFPAGEDDMRRSSNGVIR